MPPLFNTIFVRLQRHREKLIDGGLLFVALNVLGISPFFPRTPWPAQATMLALFVVLSSPRAHLVPGLWRRYLRYLPGYAAAAAMGVLVFGYWFSLPRSQAWFAPLWLALTALARLQLTAPVRWAAKLFRARRLDVVCTDLIWCGGFSYAVPRWSQLPFPHPAAVTLLLLAWSVWHGFRGGCDPAQARSYRHGYWAVAGLALAWGVIWSPAAGLWPATVFTGWLALGLLVTRRAGEKFGGASDTGAGEVLRWIGLFAVTAFLFHPFAGPVVRGGGDSYYYATFLADSLTQFRHGVFPVFVGQSEYQFNGAVIPTRIAPGFQYLGGLLDMLTGRTLGAMAVQNLLIALTALAGTISIYACLRRLTSATIAWLLALLFLTCPGVVGLALNSDLYMSWLTMPWVPVVLYLSWRSFPPAGNRLFAALGFGLGFTWWLHAPIALWLTLVAAGLQLARLIWARPPWRILPAQLGSGAGAFLATAAYPLVSAAFYPADPSVGSSGGFVVPAKLILERLQATFPAAWLPLSYMGRELTDFQIGYGLLAVGALAVPVAWRSRRAEPCALAAAAVALLLLLLPIPWLNLALWRLVPDAVRVVTNIWAMQRLYLVLAGCLAFLAAAVWATHRPATWLYGVLIAASFWSATEAMKFTRGSWALMKSDDAAPVRVLPENITLTRYSYGMFERMPAYFTHGVTDPVLENRFLAPDLRTVVGGNQETAVRLARSGAVTEVPFTFNTDRLTLQRPLTLQPGRRYLAEMVTSVDPFPTATLILRGETMKRLYGLPEYGGERSFGLGGQHVPFLPLHTSATRAESVGIQLIPADGAENAVLDRHVALRLGEYDPATLPVQIHSWMPYTATVRSDGPVWLETPRMYQAGYAASVNGRPVEVRRSTEGLASLPVPAGNSQVELRYVAPLGMSAAFWLSFAAIGLGGILAGWSGWRVLREPGAGDATSTAGDR